MKTQFFKWLTLLAALLFSVNMSAQTAVTLFETDLKDASTVTTAGASIDFGGNSNIKFDDAPSWGTGFTGCISNSSGSGNTFTLTFPTSLKLNSNGTDKGTITVIWGAVSDRSLYLALNSGTAVVIDAVKDKTSKPRSTLTTATYVIPNSSTDLSSLKFSCSGGGGYFWFSVKVETYSSGPYISAFSLAGKDGVIVNTDETTGTISVSDIPYATDLSNITPPTITPGQNTNSPANASDPNAFSSTADPLVWTATYEVTSTIGEPSRTYTVTASKKAPSTCGATGDGVRLNDDFEVAFRGNTIKASVDNSTKEIKFNIPFTTTLAELETEFAPTFTANGLLCTTDLASWTPAPCSLSGVSTSGDVIDFSTSIAENNGSTIGDNSNPAKIIIMPQDGTACEYTVKITRLAPDVKCSISEFYFVGYEQYKGTISGTDISVTLPSTTDVANLTAFVDNNSLAATPIVLPLPTDYSAAQTITVISEKEEAGITAAPGEELTKTYTVTVTLDATAPAIQSSTPALDNSDTEFSLAGVMKLLYDEDLVAGTGDITLRIKGGAIHTTIPAASIALSGKEAKFNFSGLTDLTEYELIIPAGIFADKYGNPVAAKTIEFKTADGTLKDFPYSGCMQGEDYAVPAFITGATYNPTADTKATTPNQYGAYEIPAGASLVITADKMGSIYASIYALGGNRSFSITEGSSTGTVFATEYLYNYENKGTSIRADINATATTSVYINNDISSSGSIFVPFIYISADNTTMTANEACCK